MLNENRAGAATGTALLLISQHKQAQRSNLSSAFVAAVHLQAELHLHIEVATKIAAVPLVLLLLDSTR
jgi:uncharacterized membrane protein